MNALTNLITRYGIVAWRRRWIAVVMTWAICLGGWAFVTTIPNQYQSSARIYVDTGAVLTPLLRGLALDSSQSSDIDILQRTLLSRPNLEKLISKTDLDARATTRQERDGLIQALAASIHIQPQTRNLFTIDYTDSNAQLARDVVQTLVTQFIESATGTSRDDMESARAFLERQIGAYETKLRAAERSRAAFQVKYADVLPAAAGGTSRVDAAHDQAVTLKGQVTDATARRDLLRQEMANTPALLVTESAANGAGGAGGGNSSLAEAQRRLETLKLRFTDKYPDVVSAQKLVDSLRAGAGSDGTPKAAQPGSRSVPNPLYEQLKVRLVDAESNLASLERQANEAAQEEARLTTLVRGAPGVVAEYTNLNRDYEVLRKNYDELLARRESMRIGAAADEQADKVKLRIVDAPQVPTTPVGPKRFLLTVFVLFAGLGAGCGVIFLLIQFDSSFYSVQELRAFGLPVAGGISMQSRPQAPSNYAGKLSFAASVVLLALVFGGFVSYPQWHSRYPIWLSRFI
jgi:polysaccharide chain length determinant protein (PEP-CTERM system associated)